MCRGWNWGTCRCSCFVWNASYDYPILTSPFISLAFLFYFSCWTCTSEWNAKTCSKSNAQPASTIFSTTHFDVQSVSRSSHLFVSGLLSSPSFLVEYRYTQTVTPVTCGFGWLNVTWRILCKITCTWISQFFAWVLIWYCYFVISTIWNMYR